MTLEELSPLLAESMSMSIWLRSDGLAFSISRLGQEADQVCGHLPFSSEYLGHIEALQDLIYAHEWLCYPYQRVYLYYVPTKSVIIPLELYEASRATLWLEGICLPQEVRVLPEVFPLENKVILSAWDKDLLGFFERIHPPLSPRPYYLPIIEVQRLQSRREGCRMLIVSLQGAQLDCIAISSGDLLCINHYEVCSAGAMHSVSEMMYYMFLLWQALGFDYKEDVLLCFYEGEAERLEVLCQELRAYIARIELAPLSSIVL
ncbi:MAG: DUF3822 family protein [Porphyromonadaceae bacterium]|nr:DUF3822 family protein [Porphyromonadaceae bacterium]